jgi:hypothetical protein
MKLDDVNLLTLYYTCPRCAYEEIQDENIREQAKTIIQENNIQEPTSTWVIHKLDNTNNITETHILIQDEDNLLRIYSSTPLSHKTINAFTDKIDYEGEILL